MVVVVVVSSVVVVTVVGMWFSLQADIELAKELPEPPVSRTEYDLKDQLIRETIMNTGKKVEENSDALKNIDEKLFEIKRSSTLSDFSGAADLFRTNYYFNKKFQRTKV